MHWRVCVLVMDYASVNDFVAPCVSGCSGAAGERARLYQSLSLTHLIR